MKERPSFDLFLTSWLILFLELACIRWFSSHVMFLTFFTNIVLLAGFVGMSIGCMKSRSRANHLAATPYWLALAIGAGLLCDNFRNTLLQWIAIGDRSNPDVVFFGAEAGDSGRLPFRLPVEAVAGFFFLLIAIVHIGPGQEMGRAFLRVPSRARAYSMNLLGSLAGIGSFAACSLWQLPPIVWFSAVALGIGGVLCRAAIRTAAPLRPRLASLSAVVILSGITSGFFPLHHRETTWSPYYRIDFIPQIKVNGRNVAANEIETNMVSHQIMDPVDRVPTVPFANYALPYMFQRDLRDGGGSPQWAPFRRVLIIGAGSGNDVARACQWLPADARIDAVEIDPVIHRLGEKHHPSRPYADPRVHVELNDGRNFLRSAPAESYDLVIFALVDSLVLHSGYSNLRLESYLFTEESFRDARRVLKKTGVCAVYNYLRHGWLAARVRSELRDAFAADPGVFVLTRRPKKALHLNETDAGAFTAFLAGSVEVIGPLRAKFEASGNCYWAPGDRPPHPSLAGVFGPNEPASLAAPPPPGSASINPRVESRNWTPVKLAEVEELGALRTATDDWPFLYVREPGIPLVSWRGMALIAMLSLLLWVVYRTREKDSEKDSEQQPASQANRADHSLALRSFFLGAGFMLVETKAVVHMALLFGSTWSVNTVVFSSILAMSLVGNLLAGRLRPRRLAPWYAGLFASIALGLAIPLESFLGMGRMVQIVGACLLVFAPIGFAGVIFACSFGRASRPDRVMGANAAGALLGGLAENASVVLGFHYLLCVAAGFYLLSGMFGNTESPLAERENEEPPATVRIRRWRLRGSTRFSLPHSHPHQPT